MSGSIELQRFAERERNEWGQSPSSSGLHRRKTTVIPEEVRSLSACAQITTSDILVFPAQPDVPIHFPVMSPTHVIADTSAPSSPGGQSIRTSALPSADNSPAYPSMSLYESSELPSVASKSPTPSLQVMSPTARLPTPVSDNYPPSPRATPPPTMPPGRSPLSMRQPPADLSASLPNSTSYNTPLGGSLLSDVGGARAHTNPLLNAADLRVQSPFSDAHSVDPWLSSPEHASPARTQPTSPDDVRSPSMASDLTLDSDEDFDIMSPRSGMFSPPSRNAHVDEDPFEIGSQHESEASWTSVGHRAHSPTSPF